MVLRLTILLYVGLSVVSTSLFATAGTDWPTMGNGPAHTGYQPSTARAPFVAGWAIKVEQDADASKLQQPAIAGNSVYISPENYFENNYLASYSVQSGAQQWRFNFARANVVTSPTVDGNAVYIQRNNHSDDSQLWSFNATTGLPIWSAPYLSQWDHYYAPTVANGNVFTGGGYYGGAYGFSQTGGTQTFFVEPASDPDWWDEWTPSYYDGKLYEWQGGIFAERSAATGAINWSTDLGWDWNGWSMETTAAIDNGRAFLIGRPNLIAVNLATHAKAWEIPGQFTGSAAVANGVVYAIQQNNVVAYNAATGAFVASYVAGQKLYWQPIVTDNLLMVSSEESTPKTYVFKLGTSVPVQVIPYGGKISFAANKLYIGGTDGYLRQYVIPSVSISATDAIATEGSTDVAQVTVSIPSPATADLNIAYSLSGNVANGVDIATLSGTVMIGNGTSSASFLVTALNNGTPNSDRTLTVTLTSGDGYEVGGTQTATVSIREPRPVVSGFPATTIAGVVQGFMVSMKDSTNGTATGFTGTLGFSSTDAQAVLPANYTFVAGDNGIHTFSATLKTAGARLIQSQIVGTTISGAQSGITVQPAAASTLKVTGPSVVTRGVTANYSVAAQDPFGNTDTQYSGAVQFSSSDGAATLPANYGYQGGDQGVHNFAVTFLTEDRAGTTSLTATDTVTTSISNTKAGITVNPPPPTVTNGTASITAGDAFSFAIVATENPTAYNATGLPTGLTRTGNVISGTVTRAGVYSIGLSATNPGGTGTGTLQLTVLSGAAHHLTLNGFAAPIPAGTAGPLTVVAEDIYNNRATGYLGTIAFSSSDTDALIPANHSFSAGDQGQKVFSVMFLTIGIQSIKAEDTTASTIQGSLINIQVNPVPPVITSPGSTVGEQGTPFTFALTATGYPKPTFQALNLPPGLSLNGNTISGTPTVSGVADVLVKASNVAGETTATLSITLLKPAGASNTPPVILSMPTVNPNPGQVGQPVNFSVTANDAEDAMLGVTWDFGDGTGIKGIASSHIFNAPGLYDVKVGVGDGVANTTMIVKVAINGTSGGAATTPTDFAITKASLKLNFSSANKDSLALAGTVPVEVGFSPMGAQVVVVAGAYEQSGALDGKGRLSAVNWSLKFTGKIKLGAYTASPVKFAFACKKTSLFSSLRDFGVANEDILKPGEAITLPVILSLKGRSYLYSTNLIYTATKGKQGSAKLK